MSKIIKRFQKLSFYGVPAEDGTTVFHRMKGFETLSTSKNPREYSRQYTDEEFSQTDVVGYDPSVAFSFDQFEDSAVHADIAQIFDGEKTGADAVRSIIMADLSANNRAIMREFAVIAEKEGDGTGAYTYSGSFRVKGDKVFGTVTSDDNWQTVTFVPDETE